MKKALLVIGAMVWVFPLGAQAAVCSGVVVLDVTQQITNDPDSGNFGGYWALDNFSRRIQIFQEGADYCAQADDNGTFTTADAQDKKSPQSGADLPQTITGTIVGGTHGTITGTFDAEAGALPAIDCAVEAATCASGLTSYWVEHYFPGGNYDYGTSGWGWTYTSSLGEVWVNAATGNSGDIHGIVNTTSHVGYETLQAAINAAIAGDTIELGGDTTTNALVLVNKALTINGNGYTLFAPINNSANNNANNAGIGIVEAAGDVTINNLTVDGTGSVKIHGINIFESPSVTLDGVMVKNNSKSGITVNGSTVTVNNVTTANNAWGGINVDQAADAPDATILTIMGNSTHTETGPDIWKDDVTRDVTVNDPNHQYVASAYTHDTDVIGTVYTLIEEIILDNSAPTVTVTNTTQPIAVSLDDSVSNPTIDVSSLVTADTATLPQITIESNMFDVTIAANTVVTGPTGWNGVIKAPILVASPTGDTPAGFRVGDTIISIGSDEGTLTFDNPVTLVLSGVTGTVGYKPSGSNIWTTISNTCDSYDTPSNPPAGSECSVTNGTDTKIVTYHFTEFGELDLIPPSLPEAQAVHRSNGGTNRAIAAVANTPAAGVVGEVLGAATVSPEIQSQIDSLKAQLAVLIQELIKQLQAQLATALLGVNQ